MKKSIIFLGLHIFANSVAVPIRLTLNNNAPQPVRATVQCIKPGGKKENINTTVDKIDAMRIIEPRTSGYLIFESSGICNVEVTQSNVPEPKYFGQLGLNYEKEIVVPTPGFTKPRYQRNLTWWLVGRNHIEDGVNPRYWEIEYTLKDPQSFIY